MPTKRGNQNQHVRTRNDHATELAEDYVEAVADFVLRTGECRVKDLANHFEVTHVTASRTVSRLQKAGLVTTQRHAPIELTLAGKKLAAASQKRHEIVLRFLKALGVSDATAAVDAEGIEHHVSAETLRMMEKFADQESGKKS